MARLCLLTGVLTLASACGTGRYVGSIGRDRTYANRGFGLALRLAAGGLEERWQAIDPAEPEIVPRGLQPRRLTSRLDLDGSGRLELHEMTQHMVPTLRLVSRTSTAVRIDIHVIILARRYRDTPLEAVLAGQVRRLTRTASTSDTFDRAMASMRRRTVTPNFEALIVELPPLITSTSRPRARVVSRRIALVDQPDLLAEEGIRRRQIVRIDLVAPRISARARDDLDVVLDNLILNRRGASETTREKW